MDVVKSLTFCLDTNMDDSQLSTEGLRITLRESRDSTDGATLLRAIIDFLKEYVDANYRGVTVRERMRLPPCNPTTDCYVALTEYQRIDRDPSKRLRCRRPRHNSPSYCQRPLKVCALTIGPERHRYLADLLRTRMHAN